jgi:hypothetical protein
MIRAPGPLGGGLRLGVMNSATDLLTQDVGLSVRVRRFS